MAMKVETDDIHFDSNNVHPPPGAFVDIWMSLVC